jgi:MoaA/NifB/PqqE/SkfB family radical SAM enzyme
MLHHEEVASFFSEVNPSMNDSIELSGGEPTIHPDFCEILSGLSAEYSSHISVLSNSRRFSNRKLAQDAAEAGLSHVVTALYSQKPVIHDCVTRRKGSYEQTLEGIENVVRNGMDLSIKTLILKQNFKELPKMIEFWAKAFPNESWFSIHGLDLVGEAAINFDKVAVSFTESAPFIEQALDMANELGLVVVLHTIPMCVIDPYYWGSFGHEEKVSPYEAFKGPDDEVIGNVDSGVKEVKGCSDCDLSFRCLWPWRSYIQHFGTAEIKPHKL